MTMWNYCGINCVITDKETFIYGYEIETNAQSSQWKHPGWPRPKKARQIHSSVKVILT